MPKSATQRVSADPTPQNLRVLRTIHRLTVRKGFAPSLANLCEAFGWQSKHSAFIHIRALLRHGLVTREPGVARSLVLTPTGRRLLAAERGEGAQL